MTGSELRNILKGHGIVMNELAERLGISNQALGNRLSVKNIKADFLLKVEQAVGFKIEPTAPISIEVQQLIELLKKKDEQLDRLIALLERRDETAISEKRRNVG